MTFALLYLDYKSKQKKDRSSSLRSDFLSNVNHMERLFNLFFLASGTIEYWWPFLILFIACNQAILENFAIIPTQS